MKVIACYSVKGGVGKTSAAVNLASLAAQAGKRTLLWDLDPQAAATYLLRTKAKVKGGTRKLLQGESEVAAAIRDTEEDNLDVLPASASYADTDLDLAAAKKSEQRVSRVLAQVADDYDIAVIDSPPGLNLLATNVVRAADVVLTPIVPSPLSMRTLDQVADLVAETESSARILAFLSMADRRRALHRDVIERVHGSYRDVAQTVIPVSATIERMGQRRRPVQTFAPSSPASTAYRDLWNELVSRLEI
ncbi:MAG TPA: ParA family protein [Mycobacteriales bacterium]|nr:ParA family protein [Mycobacteriales bacterium]